MTTFKNLLVPLAIVGASASALAQNQAPNPALATSSGLLGFSYAEAGLAYVDVKHTTYDTWGAGVTLNTPVQPNIDFQVDYAYSAVRHYGSLHANDIALTPVYYLSNYGALKPFATVDLGYEWVRGDNRWTWGASAGVEYQFTPQVSATASVDYDSDFERNNGGSAWSGSVTGHYWFTRQIGGWAGVTLFEHNDVGWAAGATYRY